MLSEGRLAGIVTPKDLLNRVVAKDLDPETTVLSDIMTPNPDTVPPEMTVLEALREVRIGRVRMAQVELAVARLGSC